MIKTFGLHWHIDRVDWGRPNRAGTLMGATTAGRGAKPVDFRDQRGIYALYADYELVYIGQAGAGDARLFSRLKKHKGDHLSQRWNRFSWFGTQWVLGNNMLSADNARVSASVKDALNILEAVAISIGEPRLNLQRGKWKEIAVQYYQYSLAAQEKRNHRREQDKH
jgi:hypothetical protein